MLKPSVTFVLWLAIALFIVVNDVVGDTWIAATLTVRTVEWYKVLVPLPYVAMLAIIHARRTAGPPDAAGTQHEHAHRRRISRGAQRRTSQKQRRSRRGSVHSR